MPTSSKQVRESIERLMKMGPLEDLIRQVSPVSPEERPPAAEVPERRSWGIEGVNARREFVADLTGGRLEHLFGEADPIDPAGLKGAIEHFIGMTQVPTGIIGPLRINGVDAVGDFYVPLATTEGALIASYHRGAIAATLSGGVTSVCLLESVQRSPCFRFDSFAQAGAFLIWVMEKIDSFQDIVSRHSGHARLTEVRPNVDGNQVTLVLEFTTGDAAGQNMVTICTDAICTHIVEQTPIKPRRWFVEGNLSGDKKATAMAFLSVRGKKVTAEAVIPGRLVRDTLRTDPEAMLEYWKLSVLNGVQSGSIGVNGHFANGLAALFLACGQDVACVSEAAVGTTRFDITEQGDLYTCVTLPNLIVGTVGGGTVLPTQHECLRLLGCVGDGTARKFAEICAATVLCGEISIVAAIAAGEFARSHALFGRRRRKSEE